MKFLIDTHILLWHLEDNPKQSETVKKELQDSSNQIFISQASLWEMSIKISLGKLKIPMPLEDLLFHLERSAWAILPIQNKDILSLLDLPYHHSDPIDRIIAAQCLNQDLTLFTQDSIFELYGVKMIESCKS